TSVFVLPVPAPATTSTLPRAAIASCWAGVKLISSRLAGCDRRLRAATLYWVESGRILPAPPCEKGGPSPRPSPSLRRTGPSFAGPTEGKSDLSTADGFLSFFRTVASRKGT